MTSGTPGTPGDSITLTPAEQDALRRLLNRIEQGDSPLRVPTSLESLGDRLGVDWVDDDSGVDGNGDHIEDWPDAL